MILLPKQQLKKQKSERIERRIGRQRSERQKRSAVRRAASDNNNDNSDEEKDEGGGNYELVDIDTPDEDDVGSFVVQEGSTHVIKRSFSTVRTR